MSATAATTKRTFSEVDEKDEITDPQPPKKRARVAPSNTAAVSTITTPLAVIFRILQGPQTEQACQIWPIERTGSENVSVTALITCAMYSNISMPKLMKSWERVITEARAIYDAGVVSNPPTPPYMRAIEIWQKIRDASTYKYAIESPNFLYDLFVHGNCQCSCGSVAMKEILERVDPNLGTMLILEPHHVRVSVEGGGNPDTVTLLETTSKTVNRETMTYEELWQSKTLIPFVEQDLEACFFGREWLRYIRYRSNEGALGISAQQQILARIYQGWEEKAPGTSALSWSAAAQMFHKVAYACYLFVGGDSNPASTETQQAIQQVRVEAHAAAKLILSTYDLQPNTEPSTQIQKAALYAAWFYKELLDFAGHMVVVVTVDSPEP